MLPLPAISNPPRTNDLPVRGGKRESGRDDLPPPRGKKVKEERKITAHVPLPPL
jgi:hypothetical protein